jgi:hypothetical protein
MLLLAVAHKFGSGSSKRLEVIHKVGLVEIHVGVDAKASTSGLLCSSPTGLGCT